MTKILIGADPELFIKKNGHLVSAYGMFEGTKESPQRVNKGAVQVDGMAAEFNIDPASSSEEFVENITCVMDILEGMLEGCTLHADPVAHFGKEMIEAQPEEAKILGCEPDFLAWADGKVNTPPDASAPFRTGAGHIHVGLTEGEDTNDQDYMLLCAEAVKQMDFYLGLPSLIFDNDTQRRSLYGAAGCFRPKPYGFEYRTLSNKWLSSKELMSWAYNNAVIAMTSFMDGERLSDKYGDIQQIINNSDVEAAKAIIKDAGIPTPNF